MGGGPHSNNDTFVRPVTPENRNNNHQPHQQTTHAQHANNDPVGIPYYQQHQATPYSGIIDKYITTGIASNQGNNKYNEYRRNNRNHKPIFGTSKLNPENHKQNAQQGYNQQQTYNNSHGKPQEQYEEGSISTSSSSYSYYDGAGNNSDQRSINTYNSTILWLTVILPTILSRLWSKYKDTFLFVILLITFIIKVFSRHDMHILPSNFPTTRHRHLEHQHNGGSSSTTQGNTQRPNFVYSHPYVTSSYYTSTTNIDVLEQIHDIQVKPKQGRKTDDERGIETRLAIVRPFCEFDAQALPTTFACWNSLVPCRAAEDDLGQQEDEEGGIMDEWVLFDMSLDGTGRKLNKDEEDDWDCEDTDTDGLLGLASSLFKRCKKKQHKSRPRKEYFDDVPADALKTTSVDLFLFYSQTFSENEVAIEAVDAIMAEFYSVGGWSRCFDNIFAVEANIPKELDLYIPAAQEELYNWVNGPNRQYEAGFRIIQSGEWGVYDGFYLMEGDSVPVKNYWLDVILGEINSNRPFAVLGAQYDGDKWDSFFEDIPISLLHHTNGNAIYNTSHPLLERMTGQLEVEAPCPYNSIPYDYRMSQMWVEGTLGIVPKLAPKIMLNNEGENITLSDNIKMFTKWANQWKDEQPYKFTKAIHNYASTNLIPRHLGPEYVIHGAKLYSPWDPARTRVTLVISEWFFDRSLNLIKRLDTKDHPFSKVIIMVPPSVVNEHDYTEYTSVPVKLQFRDTPDYMDLCSATVETEWFMITNSYHQVSRHVDLMFTPGKFLPVVPFTPATYPFCLKYPYCKENVLLAQRWNPRHKQVVLDMDMLYNTEARNEFCKEWFDRNGESGEHLYARHQPLRWKLRNESIIGPNGPTATDYLAYLTREKKDDRSLYGARAPFVKVYRKEEKLDGMSEDELARRLGMTLLSNTTECTCDRFETEEECLGSGLGCQWRPLFESCHPPEMIDDGIPICETTDAPTLSPTISIERMLRETDAPTIEGEWRHWHWWMAPKDEQGPQALPNDADMGDEI